MIWEISHFLCAKMIELALWTYAIFPLHRLISARTPLWTLPRRRFVAHSAYPKGWAQLFEKSHTFFVPKQLRSHSGLTQYFHFIVSLQLMLHFAHHPEDAWWHKESTQCQSSMIWEISRFLCAKIFGTHGWLTQFFGFIVQFQLLLYSGYSAEGVSR